MRLSHQAVECPHFCALLVCTMQIRPRATPKNPLSLAGGYEKRLDALLIAPKLLCVAKGYHLKTVTTLARKAVDFVAVGTQVTVVFHTQTGFLFTLQGV